MKKSDVVIAFSREELNVIVKNRLARKFEVDDDQWDEVSSAIHNDDYAWSYIYDTIDEAVDNLVDAIKHELSCQNKK